jgi:hypothetical protein
VAVKIVSEIVTLDCKNNGYWRGAQTSDSSRGQARAKILLIFLCDIGFEATKYFRLWYTEANFGNDISPSVLQT